MKRYEIEHSIQEALEASVTIDGVSQDRKLFMVADVGLSVTILDLRGVPLTLYADETGSTTVSNPVTADPDTGRIEAWTEAPDHDIVVSGTGIDTYTQYVRTSPFYDIRSYGAIGDGIYNGTTWESDGGNESTNTAAIQATIDAASGTSPFHGGTVYTPGGVFCYDDELNAANTVSITLLGGGATADLGLSGMPTSTWFYTGGDANFRAINAQHSYGFTIHNMAIMCSLPYKGVMVDAGNNGGGDTQFFLAYRSAFGGIPMNASTQPGPIAAINFANAIFSSVISCHFGNMYTAIRGKDEFRVFIETLMPGGTGENEVNKVWCKLNTPGVSTFTLTVNGQTTSAITEGASAATVQSALEALSNVAPGDVVVTEGTFQFIYGSRKTYTLAWQGALANTNMTITSNVGSTGYSNVIQILRNSFLRTRIAMANPGEAWVVEQNGFEGLQGGGGSKSFLKHAITCDLLGGDALNVQSYRNNWHGDAFGDQVWVKGNKHGVAGTIADNQFSGGWAAVDMNPHLQSSETAGISRGPLDMRSGSGGTETNYTDAFGSNTIANYTFDEGSGTLAIASGTLNPSSTALKRLYKNNIGSITDVDHIDFRQSLKCTPDATLTGAGKETGFLIKRIDASNYIYGILEHTANPPKLQLFKVVGGTPSQLGSDQVVTTAIANGVPFWVRGEVADNKVYAEYWTAAPAGSSEPEVRLSYTMTDIENPRFGCRVSGYAGLRLEPPSTGWTYDDYVVLPRSFALDIGNMQAAVGVQFGGSGTSHVQGWPPFIAGAGTSDPVGDIYTGHARISMYPVTMNGNGAWVVNKGFVSPRISGGDAGEHERATDNSGALSIKVRHYTKELVLVSTSVAPTAITGAYPGQVLTLSGDNTGGGRTIVPSAHFVIKGDMTIAFRDTLTMVWDNGVWTEISRSKNANGAVTEFKTYQERTDNANWTLDITAARYIEHTGTLTNNRNVTLSTVSTVKGQTHTISRTGGDTGGPWVLNIGTGPLTTLSSGHWCDVLWDGTAWIVLRKGTGAVGA